MADTIRSIKAREIIAQRGVLSLEVTVTTDGGSQGVSTPESGVSTGTYEAAFLLDGGERYNGLGVRKAASQINEVIAPALRGMDVAQQLEIDRLMIELDGTPNKARLGANAIVGVSLAVLKAAAASAGLPLYRAIGGVNACTLPIPIVGIGAGGRYRDPGSSRWFKPSYEFAAYGAGGYSEALYWSWRCAEQTKRLLRARYPDKYSPAYHSTGLAGVIDDDRELLEIMTESIVALRLRGAGRHLLRCGGRLLLRAGHRPLRGPVLARREDARRADRAAPGFRRAIIPSSRSKIRSTKMTSRGMPSPRASWASRWWETTSSRPIWSG